MHRATLGWGVPAGRKMLAVGGFARCAAVLSLIGAQRLWGVWTGLWAACGSPPQVTGGDGG